MKVGSFGGHANKPENMLKSVAGLSKLWDGAPITRTRAAEGERITQRLPPERPPYDPTRRCE